MKKKRTRLNALIGFDSGDKKTIAIGVDRENGILAGFSACMEGPALGHDMDVDGVMLDQLVEQGNAAPTGIKARFTHPGLSNDGLGTFLGSCKNFRKDGNRVRCDLHFSKTAQATPRHGDLQTYICDLAEESPDKFGASIVFSAKLEYRLNPDGTRQRDEEGEPLPPLARIEKLYAVDIVDDPAANADGLFAADPPDTVVRQVDAVIESHFADAPESEIRERASRFLDRYFARRPRPDSLRTKTVSTTPPADQTPPVKTYTEAELAAARTEALNSERGRVSKILGLCRTAKLGIDFAEKHIADGSNELQTQSAVITAMAAAAPAGSGNSDPEREKPADEDAAFKAEYSAGKKLYEELGTSEFDYVNTRRIDCGKKPHAAKK